MPELLTRGHVVNQKRVAEIEKRARFSNYVLLPTRHSFKKFIGIMINIIKFIIKSSNGRPFLGPLLSTPLEKIPTIFSVATNNANEAISGEKDQLELNDMKLEEKCFRLVVTYLFRKTTKELIEFTKPSIVDKQGHKINDIIYSKNRLLETVEFTKVTGMDMIDLDPLSVNVRAPLIDRFSPFAYAIAQYIHWDVSNHAGLETCHRLCLERVHILQSYSLFKEISMECAKCRIKRKKFLEVSTGPIGDHQLTIAPAFYASQADLFGPISVFVPGYERQTRNRSALTSKVWVMVFTCPVTRLVAKSSKNQIQVESSRVLHDLGQITDFQSIL